MTRDSIRKQILEDSQDHKYILAELPTGFGKSLIGCTFVDIHLNTGRALWLVPQTNLIQNAKDELIKWGYQHLLDQNRIEFACYASMDKHLLDENYTWDCVVCDEIHNSVSLKRLNALAGRKYWKLLGLSATLSQEIKDVLRIFGEWKVTKVSLSEAIEAGIIAEPKINIEYINLDKEIKRNPFKYKDNTVMMTDADYYEALSKSITYWRDRFENEGQTFAKNRMMQLGGQRQSFLADCKEPYVKDLLEHLGESRFICFCGSVAQAKRLGKNVCASSTGKKGNNKLIEDFNSGKIDNLLAKNMLQEGINLVDTKYGICIQLGNQERKAIQILGRSLRHPEPEIFLFVARDTVDERFLRESFKNNQSLLN